MESRKMPNAAKRKGKAGKVGGKRPCRRPPEPAEEEADNCLMDVCHVNMARLCTAGTQQRYCWLREELRHWNAILNRVNLQLREREPGKLSINSLPLQGFQFSTEPIFQDAAMLLVWLLDHHRCIEHFSLSKELPARLLVKAMRHGSNLRHVSLKSAGRKKEQSLAKAFDALYSVESLSLSDICLGDSSLPAVSSLIVRSARTLSKLELQGQLFPSGRDVAVMDAVSETKTLRELVLNGCNVTRPAMGKIAELLTATQTLTKLTLDVAPDVHCSWYEVACALRRNTSLVELRIGARLAHDRLTPVLEALETNSTLKCLHITSTLLKKEIEALGKGLEKNTGLTALKFSQSRIKPALVRVFAKVLLVNSTLECLELTPSYGIDLIEVKGLYAALAKNNTLKLLAFSKDYYVGDDRERLAGLLFESGCTHRVATDWRTGEFPFLIRTVKETHNEPVELCLHENDIDAMGPELFDALSESTALQTLAVASRSQYSCIWKRLSNTLASNSSIKRLQFNLHRLQDPSVPIALLAEALAMNTSVSSLVFGVTDVTSKILRPLARLVALNRTLTVLAISSFYAVISSVLLESLATATEENHVILEILVGADPPHGCASIRICEALRRNKQMLTAAVQFVTGSYVARHSAEAYEKLRCSGSLLREVEKATAGTKEDPGKLLAAAEYNLRCNYLVLTNVVKRGVECDPASHTQIDTLNDACWYHIAKYLRIGDVLKPY